MCSPRACLIIWTTVIFGLAGTVLGLIVKENWNDPDRYTKVEPLVRLIVVSIVVGLNLVILVGAIGKIRGLLCISHFLLGFTLFSLVSSFITWVVYLIIEWNDKSHDAGDIAIGVGFMSAIFAVLLIVPCIQWCALSATMKQIDSDGRAE